MTNVIEFNQTLTVVGAQWGDEGKGRVIDYLAATGEWQYVARFNGGPNAGHSIHTLDSENKPIKHVVHHLPSGILNPNTKLVLGNGMVLDLERLLKEIEDLEKGGISFENRLFVSSHAHVILPSHLKADEENQKRLGSTGRGIGPAYADKINRSGIMLGDLYDLTTDQLTTMLGNKRAVPKFRKLLNRIEPYVRDVFWELTNAYQSGNKILFEGAQGLLLDIDNGTYPYVTSSNVFPSYAPLGVGITPAAVRRVLGIAKAFTSRVGTGPFPTEMAESDSTALREHAGEFGSTTGRPRRLGWLDLPLLSRMCVQGGISELALTRLDSLGIFESVPVCVNYTGMEKTHRMTFTKYLEGVTPEYTMMDGWGDVNFNNIQTYHQLPSAIRRYIDLIENQCRARVRYVSVGPLRHQMIEL